VAEQTARFERVALRYREALARTDPAALALLERICLFRLGIDANLLTLIFTGQGKDDISGQDLAALAPVEVQDRLDKLVAMRLLEEAKQGPRTRQKQQETTGASPTLFSGAQDATYTVHPAVRDGFLKGLDAAHARRGHRAACEGLLTSLGGLPGREANPSDARTLDLLEEISYHTLEAGLGDTAWEIYRYQMGGYENLGRRLGAYERGERICRAFIAGRSSLPRPIDACAEASQPETLRPLNHAVFLNEWALYLSDLGRFEGSARCYKRNIALRLQDRSWKNASIGNQNLTDLLLAAGRLREGLDTAEEAVRLAEMATYAFERKDSYAYRGHARGLRGETAAALQDFATALNWQHKDEGEWARPQVSRLVHPHSLRPQHEDEEEWGRPLYRLRGVQHAWLLVRLGREKEALRLTEANKVILRRQFGEQHHYLPRCDLLLAGLARARGDLASARELQHQAQEWAVARDAKEPLAWAAWERGSIALADARCKADGPDGPETVRCLREARHAVAVGLRIARECGFGIFYIDLLLLRAAIALEEGDAVGAESNARIALERGEEPPVECGQPRLLAAIDPDCGYAWGEGLARHLLAEALLLQAAQRQGRGDFSPDRPAADIQAFLNEAHDQLTACRTIRERIQDPALEATLLLTQALTEGVLTRYPLRPLQGHGTVC